MRTIYYFKEIQMFQNFVETIYQRHTTSVATLSNSVLNLDRKIWINLGLLQPMYLEKVTGNVLAYFYYYFLKNHTSVYTSAILDYFCRVKTAYCPFISKYTIFSERVEEQKSEHNANSTQDVTPSRLSEINPVDDLTDSVRGKTRFSVYVYRHQADLVSKIPSVLHC